MPGLTGLDSLHAGSLGVFLAGQESSLRRRKAGPDEGGDGAEEPALLSAGFLLGCGVQQEQWRSYLRKPAPEVKLKVQSVPR